MHRCLKIPEIVGLVCSHLEESWVVRSKCHLAVLARTCTAFHGPALDVLWSSSALVDLLRCLPSDLWVMENTRDALVNYSMKLRRAIRATDWERVRVYAPRVKHLSCNPNRDRCRLSDVFPAISVCLPKNLFHNVQRLHWKPSDNDFHFIHLFLSPRITGISFDPSSTSALSLLSVLVSECPKLKSISLKSFGYRIHEAPHQPPKVQQAVSSFVRGLQCVESVSVDALDTDALDHICRLPSLTSLAFTALSTSSTFFTSGDKRSLISLHTLDLGVSEIEPTTRFLGEFSQLPLISFKVWLDQLSTTAQMHNLYTAVAAAISPKSLTSLILNDRYGDDALAADHAIQSQSIRALFGFVNLTSISLVSPIGIDLDNTAVSELARAWPRVETLDLSARHCASPRPRVTLECLHSFARHCPNLAELTMTFDGTEVPTSDIGSTNRVFQDRLRTLNVDHSAISTAIDVARFLSAIFPRLMYIMTREVPCERPDLDEVDRQRIEFHNLWNQVDELLPDLVAIREEEREWATMNVSGL
ncbi:hypothetical protein C8R44DRAFT_974416 [Mycena epipterygia]|nr:hypothetical protein C8R44DRAFT_974416 [Mycena epipterygia]